MPDIEVRFDLSEFRAWADRMNGAQDEVPFALARALTDAVFKARQVLVNVTWPTHGNVYNARFVSWALRVEPASKQHLVAAVVDVSTRNIIQRHAVGGTKQPAHGPRLAIPVKGTVTYTGRGVSARQRPASLVQNTPPKALRVTARGIFVGEGGRLHMRYSFRPAAQQHADRPMYEDFANTVSEALRTGFPEALERAMATSRRS